MKMIIRFLILPLFMLLPACATTSVDNNNRHHDTSYYLDLVLQWPMDAIRLNRLTTTPTETLGFKIRHFQSEIEKLSDDGTTLDIRMSENVEQKVIEGWNCDHCAGLPLVRVSVRDTLKFVSEVSEYFSVEVTPEYVILK